jgi:hypothetical protein
MRSQIHALLTSLLLSLLFVASNAQSISNWNSYDAHFLDFYDNKNGSRDLRRQDMEFNFESEVGTTEILIVNKSNGNSTSTNKPTLIYGAGWDKVAYGGSNDKSVEMWIRQVKANNVNNPGEVDARGGYADFTVVVYPGLLTVGEARDKKLSKAKPNITNGGSGPWLAVAVTDNGNGGNSNNTSSLADEEFYTKKDDRTWIYLTTTKNFVDNTAFNVRGAMASIELIEESQNDTYHLTVDHGSGDGNYEADETVSISATDAPTGKVFNRWVVDAGDPTIDDANSPNTTLALGEEDAVVRATYSIVNGLSDTRTALNCIIYPNPASEKLIVELPSYNSENLELRLSSLSGETLLTKQVQGSITEINLQEEQLPSGTYLLQVSGANTSLTSTIHIDLK